MASDMSGYQNDPNKWMKESGGDMNAYNREMAAWRATGANQPAPQGQGQPQGQTYSQQGAKYAPTYPQQQNASANQQGAANRYVYNSQQGGGGQQQQGGQSPAGLMDYATWEQQAKANAGRDWNQNDARNQYEMYVYRAQNPNGAATQNMGGTNFDFGQYGDATGMRAYAKQHGMSTDFANYDDATLAVWEKQKDPNCPPSMPYQAYDGSGCIEKPIDTNNRGGNSWVQSGMTQGGGGRGGAGGGGGGGGAGDGSIYGYLKGSSMRAINDPNEALGLLGMAGGIDDYQQQIDAAAAQVQNMPPGPARDAALARLEEQRATGHMGLSQAAAGMARGDLKGLVDLEENKRQADLQNRQFYSGLGEQARQFDTGLGWQKDAFGRTMDFNTWNQLGNWGYGASQSALDRENQLALGRMNIEAAQAGKPSWWQQALGQFMGGAGGAIGTALGGRISDIRTKENIKPFDRGLAAAMAIPTYEFEYKKEWKDDPRAGRGKQIGVMAQDLEKVAPEFVERSEDGILAILPMGLTAITLNAVKEVNKRLDALEVKVKKRRTS